MGNEDTAEVEQPVAKSGLALRRQIVFGSSVLSAGLATIGLIIVPMVCSDKFDPQFLFHTLEQENFFFDIFGFIGAAWLLTWVAATIGWQTVSKFSQWLGLLLLSVDQVNLMLIWRLAADPSKAPGFWLTAAVLQMYLIGAFFGLFTLPGLTRDGNRKLTGLGTLLLLLPWVVGRNEIVRGAHFLNGLFS